jgi:hypothetical protein
MCTLGGINGTRHTISSMGRRYLYWREEEGKEE